MLFHLILQRIVFATVTGAVIKRGYAELMTKRPKTASETLACRLKLWRSEKNVQIKEVALALNVSDAAVSEWEHAKRFPSGAHIDQLSEYTGIPRSCLLCADLQCTRHCI